MTRKTATIAADYFEAMYQRDADPWRFETSPYEREKYADSLAALGGRRFAAALEIGCSIGVFTARLSAFCDNLLAVDTSRSALDQARARGRGLPVRFARGHVPADWPEGRFDLIVFSEMLYYLDEADLRRVASLAGAALAPGGCILLVHYLGETNYPLTGDEAARSFIAAIGLPVTRSLRKPEFRLDLLEVE